MGSGAGEHRPEEEEEEEEKEKEIRKEEGIMVLHTYMHKSTESQMYTRG